MDPYIGSAAQPTSELVAKVPQAWDQIHNRIGDTVPQQQIEEFEGLLSTLTSRCAAFVETTGQVVESPQYSGRSLARSR